MTVPPGDPLGTVAQDPDVVRTQACKLVANDSTCSTTTVVRTDSGGSTAPPAAGLGLVTMALWIALIAGLVVLLVVIGRALATRSAKTDDDVEGLDDPDVEEVGGVVVDRRREPSNWRAEADAHRRAGRFRDALRCRYRALVGDLARRGLVDEIPGRTTGEERAQLHDVAPRAAPPFDRAADLFDGAWYGDVAVDEGDDDAFIELDRQVLSA